MFKALGTPNSISLEAIQLTKLKNLVNLAYTNSSFYRDLYDKSGFNPSQIVNLEDVEKIPIIERTDLRKIIEKNPEALYTRKISQTQWAQTTSGSSGIPITIRATQLERRMILGNILRSYRLNGLKIRDVSVTLKDPIDIRRPNLIQRAGVYRHNYFNIYEPIESILRDIQKQYSTIDVLKGMPSDLASLAMIVKEGQLQFPKVGKLFVDSETLDSQTRKLIEEVFKAKAIDFYATTEVGVAAFQTGDSNGLYCVPDDSVIFETKYNSKLQEGDEDIVLTGLINMTTPIIRYKIGDVCEPGSRAPIAGTSFSTVKSIHGKYLDFLVKPDGTVLSSHAAKQNLTHLSGIRRFRVIQESLTQLNIEIEPDVDWSNEIEAQIRDLFRRDIGPDVAINILMVSGLARKQENYKKFKVVESKLAQEFLSRG